MSARDGSFQVFAPRAGELSIGWNRGAWADMASWATVEAPRTGCHHVGPLAGNPGETPTPGCEIGQWTVMGRLRHTPRRQR